MKILIDNSNLQVGGGIQVGVSLLNDLKTLNLQDEFFVVMCPQFSKALNEKIFPNNFSFYKVPPGKMNIFDRIKYLKKIENSIIPDVIFTVFGPSYHKSKFTKIVGYAIPHFIYEDSPYFKIISWKTKLKLFFLKIIKIYCFKNHSDKIIFETNDARQIFHQKYSLDPSNSFVVGNTLNQIFTKDENWRESKYNSSQKNVILCLMANYQHKNLKIIPSVIDSLIDNYNFKDFKFAISLNKSDLNFDSKYDQYIDYIGIVPLEELPKLYEKIKILFFPSLLEVFSTTYLEAMYMGVPIVASDMSFSREISGKAAVYFEPLSPKDAANKIYLLLNNKELYQNLQLEASLQINKFKSSLDRTKMYLEIIYNS